MNRLPYALVLGGVLLLTSCLDRKNDGPSGPTIPPRSLLSGKVEERTITLQDATGATTSRIVETWGREGELLRRDSLDLVSGTATLRESRSYERDGQGYLTAITTRRVTASGESQEQERFTYMDYSPGVRLVTSQATYDASGRKLSETTYQYLGLQIDRATETTYSASASGGATSQVRYTQYRQEGSFEVGRTYVLAPSTTAGEAPRPVYTQEQWRRRDIYGRTLQQETLYFAAPSAGEEQRLDRPVRLELNVWQYNAYGDPEVHSYSVYTPRPTSGTTSPTPPPASGSTSAPSSQSQRYLELSDLLTYEYRYSTADRSGFPTACEVIETRGLQKVKTSTTRQISYRLFANPSAN